MCSINCDQDQSDRVLDKTQTGLFIAQKKLKCIPGIGVHAFLNEDIVRNPLIGVIIDKLNGDC